METREDCQSRQETPQSEGREGTNPVPRPRTRRTAIFISHLLNPSMVALAVFVGLGWFRGGVWWPAAIGVVIYSIIPGAVLIALRSVGYISALYPEDRVQRSPLLLLGASCYLLGIPVLGFFGAPGIMLGAGAVFCGNALLVWQINRWWKISIHAVGVGAGIAILMSVGGFGLWPLLLALPVVGWSRWALQSHSLGQLTSGAVLGSISGHAGLHTLRHVQSGESFLTYLFTMI
jgi:hypothetical protein